MSNEPILGKKLGSSELQSDLEVSYKSFCQHNTASLNTKYTHVCTHTCSVCTNIPAHAHGQELQRSSSHQIKSILCTVSKLERSSYHLSQPDLSCSQMTSPSQDSYTPPNGGLNPEAFYHWTSNLWSLWVQGQHEVHSKTLFQKQNKIERKISWGLMLLEIEVEE